MNIQINGINTNYIDEGVGDVILMIHGWGSKASLYNSQISLLKSKYRVIAINLPGHDGSSEPFEAFSVEDYAKFILDFLKELNIKKLTLIGHSVGGRIIIKLMSFKELPIEVEKIVLIDSAGVKPISQNKITFKTRIYKILKILLGNKFVKSLFPNGINWLKTKFGSNDYKNATPMMRDTLVKIVNEDLTPSFKNNEKDTLIIWGRDDKVTPLEDGQLMEKEMRNSALVVIDNAGHFPFLEQQFMFNKIIGSYFGIEV